MTMTLDEKEHTMLSRSPEFWADEGTLVLILRNEGFKLHRSLIHGQSNRIAELEASNLSSDMNNDEYGLAVLRLPDGTADPADFSVLLRHIYSETDMKLFTGLSGCRKLCSLIRVSSPTQMDCPAIYSAARLRLQELLGAGLGALEPEYREDAEDILSVVSQYDLQPLQKRLLYTVATTSHFDSLEPHPSLPSALTTLCATLQDNLIAHFTPILFTVATTATHMNCTNIFAEEWMPLVIGPALEDSGLCRPVETLRMIQKVRWEEHGLCAECCKEKRGEWEEEIRTVWDMIDGWI
ncbi:hypothetical protein BDW22DRAFT_248 [Trametopsis cervina]|nr:hypothetical protein BDW22DRAFT_248 [Trametopsis cervina]